MADKKNKNSGNGIALGSCFGVVFGAAYGIISVGYYLHVKLSHSLWFYPYGTCYYDFGTIGRDSSGFGD